MFTIRVIDEPTGIDYASGDMASFSVSRYGVSVEFVDGGQILLPEGRVDFQIDRPSLEDAAIPPA